MKLYLDNAATSFPKPDTVYSSILNFMQNIGASPGRGGYKNALDADRLVYTCRKTVCDFFHYDDPKNVIFTSNITTSLNILLKSIVKNNWNIITTSMEHNSVLRPLNSLIKSKNVDLTILQCSKEGFINVEDFKNAIKDSTKLLIVNHSSNIVGSIQPIEILGKICKENNIYMIIDTAQSAGTIPIDFYKTNCSALAFTGHKGLLGPQGTGGFIISNELNNESSTFIEGGTGSLSENICQPDILPDKFESGTMNTPGIVGLLEGIKYINSIGIDYIREHEEYLCKLFINGIMNIQGINIYGSLETNKKTPVISITFDKYDNSELSYLLDSKYGIMTRTGLHCAPLAHKTIGTFPNGTTRFSFGPFNTEKDINYVLTVLNSLAQ